ncbi:sulfurtransferase [Noviherbaspirillum cavernae]|uniref:Sulfurtransferase n=1 Tax=Noviherbaspirillum cavernae TaxID=2320862 RepID=A0A418X3V6_9BURK|nr:sulfurtransferase [Noviherbaspirillum cavernae]RJG07144.1 sulfurtransferase [Noviherbaspirillum cavernae]
MSHTTLISAADLTRHAGDRHWIIVDCRHDLTNPDAGCAAYLSGHIPGAQFAHLDTDLSDKTPGPNGEFRGRHPLPRPDAFIDTLRRWGINDDSQVIAYDAQGGMFAARLWWMLRWVGHEAVAVLDGGLPAWQAQGQQLTAEPASGSRGTITLRTPLVSTVDVNDVVANLSNRQRFVIDARAPDRFRGENETLDPVGGHIPGARNRFFKDNLQADGRFKSPEQLRADFAAVVTTPQASIMQCGSGATACHNLLAMEVAGLPGAALYPGSWSEWCADPSRPVATGAA